MSNFEWIYAAVDISHNIIQEAAIMSMEAPRKPLDQIAVDLPVDRHYLLLLLENRDLLPFSRRELFHEIPNSTSEKECEKVHQTIGL